MSSLGKGDAWILVTGAHPVLSLAGRCLPFNILFRFYDFLTRFKKGTSALMLISFQAGSDQHLANKTVLQNPLLTKSRTEDNIECNCGN
jgi:hypothetical protein